MQNLQNKALHQETQPLVTFVVTYYNLPVEMLCRCIDSILALSLRPFEREILIIDDGSEVSPMNELMRYGDDIIYIRQKNQGLSMARNKGIDAACGKYIQFVDADDHLVQVAYEHCLDTIRINENIDMVMFDFTTTDNSGATYEDTPLTSGTEYMARNNIHGTAWGYLFRKAIVGELRFTPGIYHEDEEFTPLLLIRAEQMCCTDAKAYFYDKREGSITTKADEESKNKRLEDLLGVIMRLKTHIDSLPIKEKMAIQRRVAQLTMDYIYQVIIQKRNAKALNEHISRLEEKGLFPLPDNGYTTKYKWFCKMTSTALGRNIMLKTLPLLNKER